MNSVSIKCYELEELIIQLGYLGANVCAIEKALEEQDKLSEEVANHVLISLNKGKEFLENILLIDKRFNDAKKTIDNIREEASRIAHEYNMKLN